MSEPAAEQPELLPKVPQPVSGGGALLGPEGGLDLMPPEHHQDQPSWEEPPPYGGELL